ncbi:hypothetical protein DFQ27_002175 [Actinomortierella ambigua]|uniref:GH16 domain-containing protein n=1 Tax=Actinomortierella ambigua TaxID=1343610 RepID=A0A9P6QMB9_9FUNG|nr:hypothetical protein DFQ27_002175 [Actinomortierella ambigua]
MVVAVLGGPSTDHKDDIKVVPMMDVPDSVGHSIKPVFHRPPSKTIVQPQGADDSDSSDSSDETTEDDYMQQMNDPNNQENPDNNLGDISAYGDPYYESMSNHDNFIVADGYGPKRWGCSFRDTQVHKAKGFTRITIGKDSDSKPYSCGELIWRQEDLTYGRYSMDIMASNVVGHVTSFFLIAEGETEIDVEITGLKPNVLWCNVWHGNRQNPVSIDLPFSTHVGWHNYAFDWRKNGITWYVDGQMIFNRSDIPTTAPDDTSYRVAINSWTQVNPEVNIEWAGKFVYPKDGHIPESRFRNFRYSP